MHSRSGQKASAGRGDIIIIIIIIAQNSTMYSDSTT